MSKSFYIITYRGTESDNLEVFNTENYMYRVENGFLRVFAKAKPEEAVFVVPAMNLFSLKREKFSKTDVQSALELRTKKLRDVILQLEP
jgi:hypothetical protein